MLVFLILTEALFTHFWFLSDATFQGSPNFSKRFQILSYSSSEPNFFLVLAEHSKSCGFEGPSNVTTYVFVFSQKIAFYAARIMLHIKKVFFFS